MAGALLILGLTLPLFFADADRLEPFHSAGGGGKGNVTVKSTRRDDWEQKKPERLSTLHRIHTVAVHKVCMVPVSILKESFLYYQ